MSFTPTRTRRSRMGKNTEAKNIKEAKLEIIRLESAKLENRTLAEMYVYACEQQILHENPKFMEFMGELDQTPVSIEEFLDSEQFIGGTDVKLWPAIRASLIEMHRDWYKGKQGGAHTESIFAGATGNGKSTMSIISFLYFVHILGCLKNPQGVYGLSESTGLVLAIFAARPAVMRKAVYMPLRGLMEQMLWFKQHTPWDDTLKSEIWFFKQNMRITPAGLDADAVIGEAVIAAIIDEANFFPIIKQSKKVLALETTSGGRSGEYDQVQILYDTVNRRRDSRFTFMGQQVGMIMVSSSKKFVGDFTDRRIEHVNNFELTGTYIYDKTQPEVVPQERFCGDKFKISISADTNGGLVIHEELDEAIAPTFNEHILPIEYLDKFRSDPNGSLRDVLGFASTAVSPFFANRLKIVHTVERAEKLGLVSFLQQDNVDLATYGLPMVKEDHICRDIHRPRSVHIDLSSTGDFCSIGMARFDGMVIKEREGGVEELLPTFVVDMIASIKPNHANEIDIADIRAWVKILKTRYRYPISIVTYDTYSSKESIQAWRKMGITSGSISMVKDVQPFKQFREMLYDDRVSFYDNDVLLQQMFTLEYDVTKDRVTHTHGGHDDLVHAVIGSITNIARNPALMTSLVDDDYDLGSTRLDMGERTHNEHSSRV